MIHPPPAPSYSTHAPPLKVLNYALHFSASGGREEVRGRRVEVVSGGTVDPSKGTDRIRPADNRET